jgi:hypothetical protein
LRSLDQAGVQIQSLPQLQFFPSHRAVIVLVIEAGEMKDSVQRKNLDLFRNGVIQAAGILASDVSGDCDLSSDALEAPVFVRSRGKR